jgi:hypothetical protein
MKLSSVATVLVIIAIFMLTWELSNELRVLAVLVGFWMLHVHRELSELKAMVDRRRETE